MILKAALRLVRSYGTHKTTVADIAREARVGVGTVYLEFTSKEALFGALSRQVHGGILDAVAAALRSEGSLRDRLGAAFTVRFDGFAATTRARHGLDLVHSTRCRAIGKTHAAFLEREAELLAGALADDPEPLETAHALQRAYVAFVPPRLTSSNAAALSKVLPAHHRLVLARFE